MIDPESASDSLPHPATAQITDEALRVAASWLAARVHEAEVRCRGDRIATPKEWLEERYAAKLRQVRDSATEPEPRLSLYQQVTHEEHFQVIIRPWSVYGFCGDEPRPSLIWPEPERAFLAAKWSR